ncbi:uncharacterized protein (DUF2267 family) [Kitasatospora sp. SolWspMP-SS2h]|uniref:DUF2267 domain-containing protein n=1 Tax=Kitasatospora sp. SolWspMP-SS2h TaxID=1305729 RepID=UPI000DB945CE|nr:DUF2267 domain-containing protein [Kitasatospora sp. SolWspMP-SS2h]RAJ40018.1 uncharacterized protein (DUF2267 family) [Kitasatospora sp. SolWspMP-SS2h]
MTRYRHLLQQVRDFGHYSSDEEAERVLDAVLSVLGSQLTGDERRDLAAALPERARAVLTARIPLPRPVGAPAFVETLAHTLGTSLTTARWDASSVLVALTTLTDAPLTDRLLAHLPRGYALLFGRADLAAA